MDRSTVAALAILGVGAAGVAILATRPGASGPASSSDPAAGMGPNLGGLGSGLTDGAWLYDPTTGAIYDASHAPAFPGADGLPGSPGLPGVLGDGGAAGPASTFSPEFERALVEEQERSNRALEGEARRQGRNADLAGLATVGLLGVAALPVVGKLGAAVARAGAGAGAARAGTGATGRAGQTSLTAWQRARDARVATNASRAARVASTPSRTTALLRSPVARFGGAATAGAALGVGATAVLEQTGQLDRVAKAGQGLKTVLSDRQETAVKSAALPLSAAGAVAAGLAGRGSVASNVRQAYRGTVQAKAASAVKDTAKDAKRAVASSTTTASRAVASTATTAGRGARSFVRRLF